ncbi:MAG: hypothetical protein AMK69_08290 [Nitrospira bacterium SG8_3]|nr:MAG: hypothetical protein AMK69_08290 [Nitrospira bacterium SG8_3]
MLSGLCDGHDTFIASKLNEAFTIIFVCLPQDFIMDFRVQARCVAAQDTGRGRPLQARSHEPTSKHLKMHWQRATAVRV